jgi:hypothetical protein
MGRPVKHRSGPLFLLRTSLGTDEPLTQTELSRLIDVPFDSLQSAESGRTSRRGTSRAMLQKIRLHTGCLWDEPTRNWLFDRRLIEQGVPFGQHFVPVTPELLSRYQAIKASRLRPDQREHDVFLFQAWVAELFKRAPDKHWLLLSARFSDFIEQTLRDPDLRLGDPVEFFSRVSEENRDFLDAMNRESLKRLPLREVISRTLSDAERAISLLGADSEAGRKAIKMRDEAMETLKTLPADSPSTKKRQKSRKS